MQHPFGRHVRRQSAMAAFDFEGGQTCPLDGLLDLAEITLRQVHAGLAQEFTEGRVRGARGPIQLQLALGGQARGRRFDFGHVRVLRLCELPQTPCSRWAGDLWTTLRYAPSCPQAPQPLRRLAQGVSVFQAQTVREKRQVIA